MKANWKIGLWLACSFALVLPVHAAGLVANKFPIATDTHNVTDSGVGLGTSGHNFCPLDSASCIWGGTQTLNTPSSAANWGQNGIGLSIPQATITDTSGSGTVVNVWNNVMRGLTINASNPVTYTTIATLRLGTPIAGTNVTFTQADALLLAGPLETSDYLQQQNSLGFKIRLNSTSLPIFIPNRSKENAGLGATAAGNVSIFGDNSGSAQEIARFTGGGGVIVGSPTGGDKGIGALNAVSLYQNNVAVLDLSSAQSPTNKTFDNTNTATLRTDRFTLQDPADTTKRAVFDISNIGTGQTRTFFLPNVVNNTILTTGSTATITNKTIDGGSNTLTNIPNSALSPIACSFLSDDGTACTKNTGTSGATVPLLDGNNTYSGTAAFTGGKLTLSGNLSQAAWTTSGLAFTGCNGTYTDTSSTGTVALNYACKLGAPALAASSSTTYSRAYTLAIDPPTPGVNVALSDPGALRLNGELHLNLNSAAMPTPTVLSGAPIVINTSDSSSSAIRALAYAGATSISLARANGTGASPSGVSSGDSIGSLNFGAMESGGAIDLNIASVRTLATENIDSTHHGSKIELRTVANGTTNLTTQFTVNQSGGITVGSAADQGNGTINTPTGYYVNANKIADSNGLLATKVFTVATLPTCDAGHDGYRAYVTDAVTAAFRGTLTGGGSLHTPVFCDGSGSPAWKAG